MYSGSWQQPQHTPRSSTSSTTPYHYRLSNSSGFSARSPSSVNDSKSAKRKRLSIASRDGDESSDLQERLCAVVARSQLLGLKSEEGVVGSKNEPALITNTTLGPSSSSPPIPISPVSCPLLDADSSNALLPPYDLLTAGTLSPDVQRRKFFADLHPLDRILARIVRPGVAVLHVELVCMLSRFRRTLLAFTKGRLVPVPFDRTKRFYNVNDYISTTVVSIAPSSEELELEIDENEAILTQQGIPAYCRDFDPTTFEDSAHIQSLRDNPNLAAQLGIPFNSAHSGLAALHGKQLHLAPTAQRLRTEQTEKLAMAHVRRGAELTRNNKCFEAIQCFNKALSVDERCADAYVGRGAACAGCRNFPAALLDLEKAIQLQPDHRNANKYRLEVLHTYAKELERDGKLSDAKAKFGQLLALCPGHQGALEGMARLGTSVDADVQCTEHIVVLSDDSDQDDGDGHVHDRTKEGVNHHDDDDERRVRKTQNGCAKRGGRGGGKRREIMSEEEVQKNRQKLAEMEAFIATLKGVGTLPVHPFTVSALGVNCSNLICCAEHFATLPPFHQPQLVDVTLQSLLYQRQMIPEPASSLLRGSTATAEQFKMTYPKVQQILRNTFRSANGDGRIREFVMLIGATPFSPKEIYRIRVPSLQVDCARGGAAGGANASDFEMNCCCCEAPTYCEELSAKERRLIFSAVALSKTAVAYFEGCKVPGRMDKVFMFIRTKGQLIDSGAGNGEGGLERTKALRIDLKRCPCIHSLSQLVDVTLQSLLYQRQMIPEPASSLLRGSTATAEQFKMTYPKVQQILRNTFRSANGDGRIREFVMLIGATPFSPKEIYRIRVPSLQVDCAGSAAAAAGGANATDFEMNCCCCEAPTYCEELSAKERRLIFSAVALSKTAVAYFEGCKVPGRMDKVFMFIRTKGQLIDSGAGNGEGGLEEDESFEVPEEEIRRRRKIRQLRIQVNAPCTQRLRQRPRRTPTTEHKELKAYNDDYNNAAAADDDDDNNADEDADEDNEEEEEEMVCSTWYRLGPFLINLC
uniref:TPR_REGION domain-containing protein n=1 Tax=Globodera pallida TaxID=36090 RepID=A0A183BKB8_GLOPA